MAELAFPISDSVTDKLELRNIAEIGNGKPRLENRLQTGVVTLAGQAVHLQEAVVGTLLYLDQIRNLNRGGNFGKIKACTEGIVLRHSDDSQTYKRSRWLRKPRNTKFCVGRGLAPPGRLQDPPPHGHRTLRKHQCARRDITPRRRHSRRLASVDLCLSAPVLRPVPVPLPAKRSVKLVSDPAPLLLGPLESMVAITSVKLEAVFI